MLCSECVYALVLQMLDLLCSFSYISACSFSTLIYSPINPCRVQYKMPEAYDQEGVVDQEKRFAAAIQRYRSVRNNVCYKPLMQKSEPYGQ